MKIKRGIWILLGVILFIFTFSVITSNNNLNETSITTSTKGVLSNKKIEWGIRRSDNHKQPDLGSNNKKLIENCQGIAMGNSNDKYVYLTFDEGYEAGYTAKILDTLKENNVKAAFFITGHYLNTQTELIDRMIKEGHIVGNHTSNYLMSGNDIKMN